MSPVDIALGKCDGKVEVYRDKGSAANEIGVALPIRKPCINSKIENNAWTPSG